MNVFIKDLIKVGLTEYEAKAYFHLLRNDIFTATELSKLSEIPPTKIYYVLESLVKKGFSTRIPGKEQKKYRAVHPNVSLNMMVSELDKKKKDMLDLAENLTRIQKESEELIDPLGYIEVIQKYQTVSHQIDEFEQSTRRNIQAAYTPPYTQLLKQMQDAAESFSPHFQVGIDYTFIFEINDALSTETRSLVTGALALYKENGANVRIADHVPIQFLLFDQNVAVIKLPSIVSYSSEPTSMIVKHPKLVSFLQETYDDLIQKSTAL